MAILTAILIVTGRFSQDNEITAMRGSGIDLKRLFSPVVGLGLLISIAMIPLNQQWIPQFQYESRKLLFNLGNKNPQAFLEPGKFIRDFKNYIIFIHSIDKNNILYNIRIYQPQPDGPTRTIFAERGTLLSSENAQIMKLKLENGTADQPDPKDHTKFYKLTFKTYYMNLNVGQGMKNVEKRVKDMTYAELIDQRSQFKKMGIDDRAIAIQIAKRYAISLCTFIFVLIGLPLGVRTRRAEKSIGFGLALFVAFSYYLVFLLGQSLVTEEIVPVYGIWIADVLFLGIGFTLFFKFFE
jgi:lipopolysaccharide export LptBFGC system permease protein LptF